MSTSKSNQRPLSPHLSVYKWQLHAITSILTRITGNALIVGVILFVSWLLAAATSDASFRVVNAIISSWFGKLILIGSLSCLIMFNSSSEDLNINIYEFPILILFASIGMMIMVSSNDLLLMFIGIIVIRCCLVSVIMIVR